jgi:hypothetical protein
MRPVMKSSLLGKQLFYAGLLAALMISCNDDDSDPDQNPGPTGPVTITNVPADKFWNDELVITGTGFSPVKEENVVRFVNVTPKSSCTINYTSDGGAIEIVSATATQITIKVPVRRNPFGDIVCGPSMADIEITVDGNKATSTGHKFRALPFLGLFNYHYGWFDVPDVTRVGDSVMISGGLLGDNPKQNPDWTKLKLLVNGANMPYKFRSIGLESGFAFFLPVETYAEINCTEEPEGWGARLMEFKLAIDGTDKFSKRDLWVKYYPEQVATCTECATSVSKSGGSSALWKITGRYMSYTEARFAPVEPCTGASQGVAINASLWTNQLQFTVPTSILTEGCAYAVTLHDECRFVVIGSVGIVE